MDIGDESLSNIIPTVAKIVNELCKENLVIDGDFGTNTKNVGIVGEQTWKYLFPKINNDLGSNYSDCNVTLNLVK